MSLKFLVRNSDPVPIPTNLGLAWSDRFNRTAILDAITVDKNIIAVGEAGIYRSDINGQAWNYAYITPSPTTTSVSLTSIAYDGSIYVAVGIEGIVVTSPDSLSWTYATRITTQSLTSVIWNGSIFVAVGNGGVILTSTNGTTWTLRTSFTTNSIVDIAWNGTLFVAVSNAPGVIGTSTDGINWTLGQTGGLFLQVKIAYGNGIFIIVGDTSGGGRGGISRSLDGINWTHNTTLSIDQFAGIIYVSGSYFVAITSFSAPQNNNSIITSTDGITWNPVNTTGLLLRPYLSIVWSGSKYFLFSTRNSFTASTIQESSNLIAWTTISSNSATLNAIAWSGTRFAAVGGNNGTVITSDDLDSWTVRQNSTNASTILYEVTWAGNKFIAVGEETAAGVTPTRIDPYITSSSDGLNWTRVGPTLGTSRLRGIAGSGSMYVAVGLSDVILSSPDGITWTNRNPPGGFSSFSYQKVIWTGTQFVAIGNRSTSAGPIIITSSDGITWTHRATLSNSRRLFSIAWSGSLFVVVGDNLSLGFTESLIATSPDGINWTERNHPQIFPRVFRRVVWTGNIFVAMGVSETLRSILSPLTSTNGLSWTETQTPIYAGLGVVVTPIRLVSVGTFGSISVSPPIGYTTQ